ncbi:archaellin/type IV pilin N-terminal domain-containing protein [Salinigranum sp. GCM10025319]|uniref:archaellin/type IV pilin N-terminal domain-containing protein n=1 Tax=Salinigranum sp. GCM10025319 TaxID=3252687 RepID=UPI0036111ED9
MFEDKTDRGQVGIGTLIVFIAMVLVAAIAAGVLVNTAGFLQENAEQTGQQAQSQVSDRLDVLTAYATDDLNDDGTYDNVTLIVKRSAGADNINVSETTVSFVGPDGASSYKLQHLANPSSGATTEISAIDAPDNPLLTGDGDRIKISLEVRSSGDVGSAELSPGDEFSIELTTASGATTRIDGYIPNSANGDTVEL